MDTPFKGFGSIVLDGDCQVNSESPRIGQHGSPRCLHGVGEHIKTKFEAFARRH